MTELVYLAKNRNDVVVWIILIAVELTVLRLGMTDQPEMLARCYLDRGNNTAKAV